MSNILSIRKLLFDKKMKILDNYDTTYCWHLGLKFIKRYPSICDMSDIGMSNINET